MTRPSRVGCVDGASDLQAILAGLVSRGGEGPGRPEEDRDWHRVVRGYLAKPAVLALLGDAANDARVLAADLGVEVDGK